MALLKLLPPFLKLMEESEKLQEINVLILRKKGKKEGREVSRKEIVMLVSRFPISDENLQKT